MLSAPDTDMRIVVYTAPPGSVEASTLDLLAVIGVQTSSAPATPV